jgi:surfeit locus 1 family protein
VLPLYVQQLPRSRADSTRPPARIGPPPLDNGPHLSYAIQWFSFAVIGVVGLGILVFRNQRNGGA